MPAALPVLDVIAEPTRRRIYRLRAEPLAELDARLAPYRAHWSSLPSCASTRTSTPARANAIDNCHGAAGLAPEPAAE